MSARTRAAVGRAAMFRSAVLRVDQHQHAQGHDQKHEADHGQVGDLAAAPRRPIDAR